MITLRLIVIVLLLSPGVGITQTTMNDIVNYVQLTDRIATSGQPTAAQFQLIKDQGYEVVVNLMTPGTDYSLANEATIVTEHAMSYINIPVVYTDPTMDDLRLFIKTMRALDDKKVWVHCALNARVSAFMYHYLKHEERRGDAEARTTYLNKFQPDMPPAWHKFLEYNETEIGLW